MSERFQTIDQSLAVAKSNFKHSVRYQLQNLKQTLKTIELNYQAAALLEGAGFEVRSWCGMQSLHVDLGEIPPTSRKKERRAFVERLTLLRRTLDCKLDNTGKEIEDQDKRTIRQNLKPVDWPGVSVSYITKIPRGKTGVRCRLVRKSYVALVCENV